jgi:S-adenosylmethionine:tRNA-ribosyltransferase-isomerase (queuine synthetase)
MEWIFLILLFIIFAWLVLSLFKSRLFKNKSDYQDIEIKSPYEKYLQEHNWDWNIRFARKRMVGNKIKLKDALTKGNHVSAKVQKSMVVYGKSVMNYFIQKFK